MMATTRPRHSRRGLDHPLRPRKLKDAPGVNHGPRLHKDAASTHAVSTASWDDVILSSQSRLRTAAFPGPLQRRALAAPRAPHSRRPTA